MQGRRWQQGGTSLKLVGALPIAGKGNPDIAFVNIKLLCKYQAPFGGSGFWACLPRPQNSHWAVIPPENGRERQESFALEGEGALPLPTPQVNTQALTGTQKQRNKEGLWAACGTVYARPQTHSWSWQTSGRRTWPGQGTAAEANGQRTRALSPVTQRASRVRFKGVRLQFFKNLISDLPPILAGGCFHWI